MHLVSIVRIPWMILYGNLINTAHFLDKGIKQRGHTIPVQTTTESTAHPAIDRFHGWHYLKIRNQGRQSFSFEKIVVVNLVRIM